MWHKRDKDYVIDGCHMTLHIMFCKTDVYSVVAKGVESENSKILASDISFDYAFGVAEEFAKKHRNEFIFSDLDVSWNEEPISSQQLEFLKNLGYKSGISELNKGQANKIIRKIKSLQRSL